MLISDDDGLFMLVLLSLIMYRQLFMFGAQSVRPLVCSIPYGGCIAEFD